MSGRIRSIKPELTRCRQLAEVPPDVRWTFTALLMFADDYGYAEDDPRLIKADVYPFDDIAAADVDAHLTLLAAEGCGLVCRYAVNGRRLLHVPGFRDSEDKAQRVPWGQRTQKPQPSRFPPCEVGHSLNGQLPLFNQSRNGSGPVRDQTGKNDPPRDHVPGTRDQGPGRRCAYQSRNAPARRLET